MTDPHPTGDRMDASGAGALAEKYGHHFSACAELVACAEFGGHYRLAFGDGPGPSRTVNATPTGVGARKSTLREAVT